MINIIYLFAIYGLAFFIKDSDGPWGVMAWLRNRLIRNKCVGVFFFKLLSCYMCVGTHAGWIIYLLTAKEWHLNLLIAWAFAGGAISLILDAILGKLSASPVT